MSDVGDPSVYRILVSGSVTLSIHVSTERGQFGFVLECGDEVYESIHSEIGEVVPKRLLEDMVDFDDLLSRRREHTMSWRKDAFTYVRLRDYTDTIRVLINHDLMSHDEPEVICLVKTSEREDAWRGTSCIVDVGFSEDSARVLEVL